MSKISDTYIAEATRVFVEQHEPYILNFFEQKCPRTEIAFIDHCGKRDARSPFPWTFTEFSTIGYETLCVKTKTTSYSDEALVAYDSRHRADARRGLVNPVKRVVCDNPFKDGPGIAANVFLGNGRPLFYFKGQVDLIYDEEMCAAACERLRKHGVLGFDTENVAYIPPLVGKNVDAAAIVQLCGDESYCAIFVVHAWGRCFEPFKRLLEDESILKATNNVAHDISMVSKRFPFVAPRGGTSSVIRSRPSSTTSPTTSSTL